VSVSVSVAWAEVAGPAAVGPFTVGVSERGLALVCFGAGPSARRQLAAAARRLGGADAVLDAARTDPVVAELGEYLDGRRRAFEQPIDWRLTSGDQRTVLTALYESVSYGRTITYGELAVRSGAYPAADRAAHRGLAARRVGSIMGSNPVPVVVPCHRVLAADGLGGFGGGLAAKRWLLELEGALPPMLDLWPS
jgi:methylated-DNA-[protein]-cysteine S-methyltransferase